MCICLTFIELGLSASIFPAAYYSEILIKKI